MTDRRTGRPGEPELDRREFMTRGMAARLAALLGGGVVAAPAAAAARTTGAGDCSARDLRRMSREDVRQALGRIRARWSSR